MRKLYHRRLNDFEPYDEIRISVEPRYKTSGLSGDEWRTNAVIQFCFKGETFRAETAKDIGAAVLVLGYHLITGEGLPKEYIELERQTCDQKGCTNPAVGRLELKRLTATDGSYLDPLDNTMRYYRQFCAEHIKRGDCDREDADENYKPLDEKFSQDSTNTKESPSQFGGIIELKEFPKN